MSVSPEEMLAPAPPDLSMLESEREAQVKRRDTAMDEAVTERRKAADKELEFADDEEAQLNQLQTANPPVNHMQEVMKGAPILMMLTAIGGSLTRAGGMAMLSGMTGMMQGLTSGSRQQYDDSYKQFMTEYQQQRDRMALMQKIYNQRLDAYKGRADASELAARAAHEVIGDINKQEQNLISNFKTQQSMQLQLDKLAEQVQNHNDIMDIRNRQADIAQQRADTYRDKATQAVGVQKQQQAVEDSIRQIDDLLKIQDDNSMVTGAGGFIRRAAEVGETVFTDDADIPAHRYQSGMDSLMAILPQAMSIKGQLRKDQQAHLEDAYNTLKAGATGKIAREKLQTLRDILSKQSTAGDRDFKSADDVSAAYKSGKITYEQASKILIQNGWAK
jgi:hypothetical protein